MYFRLPLGQIKEWLEVMNYDMNYDIEGHQKGKSRESRSFINRLVVTWEDAIMHHIEAQTLRVNRSTVVTLNFQSTESYTCLI